MWLFLFPRGMAAFILKDFLVMSGMRNAKNKINE